MAKRPLLKRIHVNRHNIAWNKAHPDEPQRPVFTVKTSKANHKGMKVLIDGPCQGTYQPEKPLACGAVLWMQTRSPVLVDGVWVQ